MPYDSYSTAVVLTGACSCACSLIGEDRNLLNAVRLSDYFNRPTIIEKGYNFDHLSRGLTTQSQEEVDPFFTSEVTHTQHWGYVCRGG